MMATSNHFRADCSWSRTRGGFNDLPRDMPGPGTYVLDLGETINLNRSRAMDPGFSFSMGSRDSVLS